MSILSREGASVREEFPEWKDFRQGAKVVNFSFLYGGQEQVAIESARSDYNIELSFEQAKALRDGYFTLYPDLVRWHQTDGPRDVQRGYCESPLGRRRTIDSMPDEDFNGMVRKMVNTPVQNTASDLTLAALVLIDHELERRGLPVWLIGFVHDSIMLEVPDALIDEVRIIVKTAMENPMLHLLGIELPVPLKADVEIGDNWAGAA